LQTLYENAIAIGVSLPTKSASEKEGIMRRIWAVMVFVFVLFAGAALASGAPTNYLIVAKGNGTWYNKLSPSDSWRPHEKNPFRFIHNPGRPVGMLAPFPPGPVGP
jgi:hypothetical protein